MLSKYNMLIFLISVLLFTLFSKEHRYILKSYKFYSCIILTSLIFSTNIYWNINNHMVSFLHTKDNANGSGISYFNFKTMAEFIGSQFAVFGPILFASFLYILFNIKKYWQNHSDRFLILFILPMFTIISIISFFSRAHANWAAPMYIGATILTIAILYKNKKEYLIKTSLILHIFLMILFINFESISKFIGLKFSPNKTNLSELTIKDPFNRFYGWPELGEVVSILSKENKQALLLTDSRKLYAELTYYVKPHPFNMVKWNYDNSISDHFELKTNINNHLGSDFIFITYIKENPEIIKYFSNFEKIGYFNQSKYTNYQKPIYIYYLTNFLGKDE